MLVLFEIQVKGDNYYECMEISRINLEDYIEVIDLVTFEGMVYNQTEEQILLQFKPIQRLSVNTFIYELNGALYEIKARTILQTFVAFKIPYCRDTDKTNHLDLKTFFVDHVDFEGGIIIAISSQINEVKMFARNRK